MSHDRRSPTQREARGHIGLVVAGSLASGLVAAALFVAVPVIPAEQSRLTGAALCGFAIGWAILAGLSVRVTDQPQRWAFVPAAFMALGGVLLVALGPGAHEVLKWLWPPILLVMTVWMVVRIHRTLHSRAGRRLLYAVIAVLVLASIGGGYQTVWEATDARSYPMPGQLIDIGGRGLHLNCAGSGSPTVVLEAGGGEMSSNLGWIAPVVAGETRACVYDRAGRGWSDPADTRQDGARIATDLHTLLLRGNATGPYVLAGHSFGGLYVRSFAAQYPDDVAGMVLIDSTAAKAGPVSESEPDEPGSYDIIGRAAELLSASAQFGLPRLVGRFDYGSLPPRHRGELRANSATASNLRSTIDEYLQASSSIEQAAALDDFAAKPLIVLTAGSGSAPSWFTDQDRMATLSTNCAHRVIDSATHQSLIADQHDARATSRAILDVVAAVRTDRPLRR